MSFLVTSSRYNLLWVSLQYLAAAADENPKSTNSPIHIIVPFDKYCTDTHQSYLVHVLFKILLYGNVLPFPPLPPSPLPPSPLPPSPLSHRHIFNRIMSQTFFILVVLLGVIKRATAARYNETLLT
jgi:hypothetical protein